LVEENVRNGPGGKGGSGKCDSAGQTEGRTKAAQQGGDWTI